MTRMAPELKGEKFDWNDAAIARLRFLWAHSDISTARIGEDIGTTKNSVVGKAHRLDLPARPSPIIQNGAPRAYMPRQKRPLPTLPPLASAITVDRAPTVVVAPPPPPVPVVQVADWIEDCVVADDRPPPPPGRAYPDATRSARKCQWPFGEPGSGSFCYCDEDAERGRPYCAEHKRMAWSRDRKEEEG